ncbi:MAG: bifunctional serine/threonine-protein kinase/formylglycine-generating enzyme family protein [Planctomycetota bacterium]
MRDRRDDTGGINIKHLFDALVELSHADRQTRLAELDPKTRELLEGLLEADREEPMTPLFTESILSKTTKSEEPLPDKLGRYVFVDRLGEGGAAVVMLAADEELSRQVAIKLMPTDSPHVLFGDEHRTLASLEHRSIVRLYDAGTAEGWRYLAMEYMSGGSLGDALTMMETKSPSHKRELIEALADIAAALQFTHDLGITHCDVKPSNILFDQLGAARLSDFGAALNYRTNGSETSRYATPRYAAPEQLAGDKPTSAADIYGLGAVLYEVVTGKRPPEITAAHDADTVYEEIESSLSEIRFPRANFLRSICLDCLEPDPDQRYPGADSVAEDLRRWLRLTRAHADAEQIAWPVLRWARRHPGVAAGLSVVAGLALCTWLLWPPDMRTRLAVERPAGATSMRVYWAPLDPLSQEHAATIDLGLAPISAARITPGWGRLLATNPDGSSILAEHVIQFEPASTFTWMPNPQTDVGDGHVLIDVRPDPSAGLLPFAIDRFETSNAMFAEFVEATDAKRPLSWPVGDLPPNFGLLPVTGITYEQAEAYASWRGLRLPTAREWEYAAGGGEPRVLPWLPHPGEASVLPEEILGAEELAAASVVLVRQPPILWRRGSVITPDVQAEYASSVAPVSSLPAGHLDESPLGMLHMFGNVAEWVDGPQLSTAGQKMPDLQVSRGNAWNTGGDALRPLLSAGTAASPGTAFLEVGFRCARTLEPQIRSSE